MRRWLDIRPMVDVDGPTRVCSVEGSGRIQPSSGLEFERYVDRIRIRSWPALGRVQMAIGGELDWATGDLVAASASAVLRAGWDVELDLAEITFVDCHGLDAVAGVTQHSAGQRHEATVIAISEPVRRLHALIERLPERPA